MVGLVAVYGELRWKEKDKVLRSRGSCSGLLKKTGSTGFFPVLIPCGDDLLFQSRALT